MKLVKKYGLLIVVLIGVFLRLYKLGSVPVSMFGDELDVSYHAYSILKTGRDYQGNLFPMHFHSLAEWRTPLYLYSAVPTIAIFGISAWGARLPAAFFGIITIPLIYLLFKEIFKSEKMALIGAMALAISPWHIQYSRAAFEVTQLVFFLVLGIYSFIKAINGKQKYLILAGASFCLMAWVYSSAKLFSPLIMLLLFLLYFRKLLKFERKTLLYTIATCLLIGLPLVYNIFWGGGSQRFSYISVFGDPTTESEIGTDRLLDARVRGELGEGLSPDLLDRVYHNKYTFWSNHVIDNYLNAFSTDFLFYKGDPNLRHSINGMGQFYAVEFLTLLFGAVFLFGDKKLDKKIKLLIVGWLFIGVIPSAITVNGGDHATRLILILVPMLILITYGIGKLNKYLLTIYVGLVLINFGFYQHNYWVHNPIESERWWHYGFEQAFDEMKKIDGDYEKIVISTQNEPPWIFFAAWYEYDPASWQEKFPIGNDVELVGFGKVSHINKYYFGSPDTPSYWEWPQVIDSKTLYLADARELNINLITEPERIPLGLKLIDAIAYPSGEPAFYLVSGVE